MQLPKIFRYRPSPVDDPFVLVAMRPHDTGKWIELADHLMIVDLLQREVARLTPTETPYLEDRL
jgi:hypothetical protein